MITYDREFSSLMPAAGRRCESNFFAFAAQSLVEFGRPTDFRCVRGELIETVVDNGEPTKGFCLSMWMLNCIKQLLNHARAVPESLRRMR